MEQDSAERLHGALGVIVSGLVDRAFATQTAYVHAAHSLSKQAQALTSLNAHLMSVRQVRFWHGLPIHPPYHCEAISMPGKLTDSMPLSGTL